MITRRRTTFALVLMGPIMSLIGAAPKEGATPSREFDDQGYHIRLDLTRQVLDLDIPEERGFDARGTAEVVVSPTLRGMFLGFVSGSLLSQKAKQFDDGLYAAVELAAQNGAGRFRGKAAMLEAVARALSKERAVSAEGPEAIVLAAGRLGGVAIAVPPPAEGAVQATINEFNNDALRSKPIGFYTWSPALSAIFRQDRMLQSELKGRPGIEAVARALHASAGARAIYEADEDLVSRLTNPLADPSLRGVLEKLDRGETSVPDKGLTFFPPSRAHETDLVKKLFNNRPIPDGFSLADEMIRRIRAGRLDLRPTEQSGWYDYQTWALAPLVVPEKTPEATHLRLEESYRKQLLELFKGILALTRETHIKQLEIPRPTAAMRLPDRKVVVTISPELSTEPLATYYQRRAESYRFVRSVLEGAFGAEALRGMHRQTANGPVGPDLAAELDEIEGLFRGAYATVRRQVGMPADVERSGGRSADADLESFRKWSAGLADDADLGRDVRMMVPVFHDDRRGKTKVWAFLGWAERPLTVSFATPPALAEVQKGGRAVEAARVDLRFDKLYTRLVYPVTAELYVSQILDRDEFRRHCDRYKTQSAILKNLR